MAAPKIVLRKIDTLQPDPRNARTHSAGQLRTIVDSLREFGFTNPILADQDGIVAGHGRWEAAKIVYQDAGQLRFPNGSPIPDGTVPVLDVSGWSAEQRRAYMLADNQIALLAGWDTALLREELDALAAVDFNLDTIGFDTAALESMFGRPKSQVDPDEVPPTPAIPTSQPGDTWIMGEHRLRCGSSTSPDDVAELLGSRQPHLMITDPPYGVSYSPEWRAGLDEVKRATGTVDNDNVADWRTAWALFPGEVAYVWHAGLRTPQVWESLTAEGFDIRAQIIWRKPHYAISQGHYHFQHEPALYAVRKGGSGHWQGARDQSTVWDIANGTFQGGKAKPEDSKTGHGTQKPVECMKRPMENNSRAGELIYEPFNGSGSTIIAGEIIGRTVLAMELNPSYVDVAVRRWETFTGRLATLEATGQTFEEVAASRAH